jgi:hypothetical protein
MLWGVLYCVLLLFDMQRGAQLLACTGLTDATSRVRGCFVSFRDGQRRAGERVAAAQFTSIDSLQLCLMHWLLCLALLAMQWPYA